NKQTPNIDLATDSGPLRFRRHLAKLIAEEQSDRLIPLTQQHAEKKTEA
ncbi:aromatic ring-hydroxylating dioxygenase subunit alpha, partial [Pseudomonas sp. TMW22090]|nr:aromatic ring-hydroxylating dioxygenase subunit alpha [Pseudomonas sp. TMW22090]